MALSIFDKIRRIFSRRKIKKETPKQSERRLCFEKWEKERKKLIDAYNRERKKLVKNADQAQIDNLDEDYESKSAAIKREIIKCGDTAKFRI